MAFASYVIEDNERITHLWSSTAQDSERRKFTISVWIKVGEDGGALLIAEDEENELGVESLEAGVFGAGFYHVGFIDQSFYGNFFEGIGADSWSHIVAVVDTTLATAADRMKFYINGVLQTGGGDPPPQNFVWFMFQSGMNFNIGSGFGDFFEGEKKIAFVDVVSGQALTPNDFAYNDKGTWTRKPYDGSYGNFGFSLDGSNGFNDVSGNGFNFTQVGSVLLDTNDLPPYGEGAPGGFSGIYLGETQINAIKHGSDDVVAVYHGSTKIFESA